MDIPGESRLTLRGIDIFVAVVEEASMSGAARRLGASVSAVSQQVSNLEGALSAVLIDRSSRPFALTRAGQIFHHRALAILDEAARARAELAVAERTAFRRLRLGVVDEMDHDILPALLHTMAGSFPDCSFSARSGLSHENLAALENRSVDLVISAESEDLDDGLERHPVLRDPFVLAAAPGVLTGGDVMADLGRGPMVRYAQTQVLGRLIEAHLRRLRIAPPRRFEITTNPGVLGTAAELKGWAVTTALAFVSCPGVHGKLEVHPLPFPGFSRTICVFARQGVMGRLPGEVAEALRRLLAGQVAAASGPMPWLDDAFRVLDDTE